jgi:hypothetical protein
MNMEAAGKPVRVMDTDTALRTNGNRKAFALLVRQRRETVEASCAAIQQARINSVLRPVQRLAPGIRDWARTRLLGALKAGATFSCISEAQQWLGQQVAQNFNDPKDRYTFEIRRLLGDLLPGG